MTSQIHKRLIDDQVKMILDRFRKNEGFARGNDGFIGVKTGSIF